MEKSFSSSDDEGVSLSVVLQLRRGKDRIISSNYAGWCDQPPISRGLMQNKTGNQPQQQPWFEHSHYGLEEEEEEEQGQRTWSWKAKRGTWGEARNNTQDSIRRGWKLTFWCSCFLFKETTKKKSITQILEICFHDKTSKSSLKQSNAKARSKNLNIPHPWSSNLHESVENAGWTGQVKNISLRLRFAIVTHSKYNLPTL